jgi:hypothetical protein
MEKQEENRKISLTPSWLGMVGKSSHLEVYVGSVELANNSTSEALTK